MINWISFYFQGENYHQGDSYLLVISKSYFSWRAKRKSVGVLSP